MIDIEKLNQAILLTQKGAFKEAEALYLELLETEPENHILLT